MASKKDGIRQFLNDQDEKVVAAISLSSAKVVASKDEEMISDAIVDKIAGAIRNKKDLNKIKEELGVLAGENSELAKQGLSDLENAQRQYRGNHDHAGQIADQGMQKIRKAITPGLEKAIEDVKAVPLNNKWEQQAAGGMQFARVDKIELAATPSLGTVPKNQTI